MSDASGVSGWYPDPFARFELRWYDGDAWSNYVVSAGVESVDRIDLAEAPQSVLPQPAAAANSATQSAVPSPGGAVAGAPPVAASDIAEVASVVGNSSGQVVIGPTLPSFEALGRSGGGGGLIGLLRRPAVLLAVTTVLAVAPALSTTTHGAGTLASIRLGAGLLAAAGAALLPRLSGNAATVAKLLPLVFVGLQLAALVTTISAFSSGESGIGAAFPHLVGGVATLFSVARLMWSQRAVGAHPTQLAPAV